LALRRTLLSERAARARDFAIAASLPKAGLVSRSRGFAARRGTAF
jgi:hypothetical protein